MMTPVGTGLPGPVEGLQVFLVVLHAHGLDPGRRREKHLEPLHGGQGLGEPVAPQGRVHRRRGCIQRHDPRGAAGRAAADRLERCGLPSHARRLDDELEARAGKHDARELLHLRVLGRLSPERDRNHRVRGEAFDAGDKRVEAVRAHLAVLLPGVSAGHGVRAVRAGLGAALDDLDGKPRRQGPQEGGASLQHTACRLGIPRSRVHQRVRPAESSAPCRCAARPASSAGPRAKAPSPRRRS